MEDRALNRNKVAIAVAILLSALMLGGCVSALLGPEKTVDSSTASATASVDTSTIVVAEVNGVKIYKDKFDETFNALASKYYMNGQDVTSDAAVAAIKQEALDELINDEVRTQKMGELGYLTLTEQDEIQAEADMVDYLVSYIEANAMSDVLVTLEAGYTEEELEAAKVAYVDTLLEDNGIDRTQFLAVFEDGVMNRKAVEAEQGAIVPTEEEIRAKYDEYVAAHKEAIDADATSYVTNENGGVEMYYTPEGVRRVRQVLILMDEETVNAIALLRQQGYTASADTLRQQGLAAIQTEADGVLGKLQSGELTFDEAIAQYNDDKGAPFEGYPVMAGSDAYMTEFTEAAMALDAVGSYTTLVATDYGYHIIEYYADVPAGAISYDSVKEEIAEVLEDTITDEAWSALLEQWKGKANIVTYEENL